MIDRVGVNRFLAGAAGALAVLALIAGNPHPSATSSTADGETIPGMAIDDAYRITAVQLAEWLRERRPGIRVLDLRRESEYTQFSLPKAELTELAQLGVIGIDSAATIVVYAGEAETAKRAWVILRALGYEDVYFLEDGIGEWLADIMNPTVSPDASPSERADFDRLAELSRYFGGLPRVAAMSRDRSTEAVLQRTMRRGCAF